MNTERSSIGTTRKRTYTIRQSESSGIRRRAARPISDNRTAWQVLDYSARSPSGLVEYVLWIPEAYDSAVTSVGPISDGQAVNVRTTTRSRRIREVDGIANTTTSPSQPPSPPAIITRFVYSGTQANEFPSSFAPKHLCIDFSQATERRDRHFAYHTDNPSPSGGGSEGLAGSTGRAKAYGRSSQWLMKRGGWMCGWKGE